jgi:hypothetical protein
MAASAYINPVVDPLGPLRAADIERCYMTYPTSSR